MMTATPVRPDARLSAGWLDASWIVPAIFALALALRIGVMILLPQVPFSDGAFYVATAQEIAAGRGYNEGGVPTAFWSVGYPALLAATMIPFGPSLLGPLLLNLAATATILGAILWFGRDVLKDARAGRIAALLYAVYPAHIAYTSAPMSETSYAAVSIVAFALLIGGRRDWRALIAAGLLFGLATLMRPQTMLFPTGAIVALWLVYRDLRWPDALRAALLVHLTIAAVVLPWSLRNRDALGATIPISTNGGVALYVGAHDGATGDHPAIGWEHGPLWNATGIPFAERVERQVELDRRFRALAIDWIRDNPGAWVGLGFRKIAGLWIKDSDAFWFVKNAHPDKEAALTAAQWVNQLYYMLLLALALPCFAVAGHTLWRGDQVKRPLALLACMPVFVTLLAFVFSGQIRYHYPAMPFVIIAAGWTLTRIATRARDKGVRAQ